MREGGERERVVVEAAGESRRERERRTESKRETKERERDGKRKRENRKGSSNPAIAHGLAQPGRALPLVARPGYQGGSASCRSRRR